MGNNNKNSVVNIHRGLKLVAFSVFVEGLYCYCRHVSYFVQLIEFHTPSRQLILKAFVIVSKGEKNGEKNIAGTF